MERLRCPFCHDLLDPKAVDRVVCVACGADHHAECFAEHGSCAATACSSTSVGLGGTQLDVTSLREVATDREALARIAATPPAGERSGLSAWFAGILWLLVFPLAISVGVPVGMEWVGVFGGMGWVVVGLLLLMSFSGRSQGRVRLQLREPETYDAIFGVMRPGSWLPGTMPDHTEGVRERLAEGGRPAPVALPERTPDDCPSCEQPLDADDDDDGPLAYCYHCGASLAQEALPPPLDEDAAPPPTREKA